MSKRGIDTDLINKRWYRELDPEWKVLWIHLTLMCDHAGVLDVDIPIWNILISPDCNFTEEEILEVFSDKIYAYKEHKWWLVDFIDFQQKNNNIRKAIKDGTGSRFYNSIINRLELEGLTRVFLDPPPDPSQGSLKDRRLKIKDKGYKIKDKTIDGLEKKELKKEERKLSLKRNSDQFELIWSAYPNKDKKKPSFDKWKLLMPDEELFNLIYSDITERSKSYKWREEKSKYVPLFTSYIHQERWNDPMYPVDAPADESNSGSRKPYQEDDY